MKAKSILKYGLVLGLFLFGLGVIARAEVRGVTSNGDSSVVTVNTASTNLPATYGNAGNAYGTGISGASHICIVNGSTTKLFGTTSSTALCTGAGDKLVVPASGNSCFDYLRVNSRICLRSSSGTISQGIIDVMYW